MSVKQFIDKTISNKSTIDTKYIDIEKWARNFRPRTKKDLLALDAARDLEDMKNLGLYISYCRKYPENVIRSILGIVKEIPSERIRKSRGALFNYLVQKHGKEERNNCNHQTQG